MALRDFGVRLVVENVGKFQTDMARYNKSLDTAEKKTTAFAERTRKAGTALLALSAPLIALGFLSTRTFGAFEQQMARVGAVSQATSTELQALTDVATEMGRTTVFTAREAAGALEFMSLAGLSVQTQISALPQVLNLAAAAQLDMASAADIVTNAMAAFELESEQLTAATDTLVTAFTNANTDLTQLATAMKFAGPVANAAGLSFNETAATLAVMGNAGIQASLAGTSLRGAITRLLTPSKEASQIINEMGINILDTQGKMIPFVEIIRQLEDGGLSAADAMTLFGQRAGPGVLALISQGAGAIDELTAKMEEAGGVTERVAKVQMDTLSGSLTLLMSQFEGVQLVIGSALAPAIRSLAEALGPILQQIAEWIERNPKLTVVLFGVATVVAILATGLIALSFILPGIIATVGILTGAFAGLSIAMGPITLIVLGIAAAIAIGILIFKNWGTIVAFAKDRVNDFIEVLNALIRVMFKLNPLLFGLESLGLISAPQIPSFANGGTMGRTGSALVGERGPELVTLPAGSTVTPISRINEINVQATYTNPQEPNSIKDDMEFILMSVNS